ncbi:tetraspanin-3-like [Bolinopsis microptera]|uniref:tetraspanin-3-like n=1 Tax=Bolinopsis microptera TaxID=2820187 RepID=UPI003078CC0B
MCESVRGCIQGFAKVILIIINTIALLTGIVLVGMGIFTMAKGKEYLPDVGISLTTPAVFLIILGVLLFFIGCFGCFGAITGRLSLLNVYLILLGIIIVLELGVLIYGFVNKGKVESTIKDAITDPFNDVNEKGPDADAIDRATVDTIRRRLNAAELTDLVSGRTPSSLPKCQPVVVKTMQPTKSSATRTRLTSSGV